MAGIRKTKKRTSVSIEARRHTKETGKNLFKRVAEIIEGPRKNQVSVNVYKIGELAKKNPGMKLLVPGKVLGSGELTESVTVIALDYSDVAKKKIESAKGELLSFTFAMSKKIPSREIVLVK